MAIPLAPGLASGRGFEMRARIAEAEGGALRKVAAAHSAAAHPGSQLDDIAGVLHEELPQLEALLRETCTGPAPLDEAAAHLVVAGGKRVRPLSMLLTTAACGGRTADALPLAASVELIHAATLLHDDVMDEGETRRNRPASRVLWGNLVSVLSGDLLLTQALQLVEDAGVDGVMRDTLAAMRALIAGEVAQLQARGRDDIGIDGYLEIVRGKTASLFAHACRTGARVAGADPSVQQAAANFGERVGVAFQVVDDVLDLEGVPHEVGKRLGHDLAEGKTTLPLALALQTDGDGLRPLLIDARAGDTVAAARVAQRQSVRDGCSRAREFAERETEIGLQALMGLEASRERDLLRTLVRGLIDRRH